MKQIGQLRKPHQINVSNVYSSEYWMICVGDIAYKQNKTTTTKKNPGWLKRFEMLIWKTSMETEAISYSFILLSTIHEYSMMNMLCSCPTKDSSTKQTKKKWKKKWQELIFSISFLACTVHFIFANNIWIASTENWHKIQIIEENLETQTVDTKRKDEKKTTNNSYHKHSKEWQSSNEYVTPCE